MLGKAGCRQTTAEMKALNAEQPLCRQVAVLPPHHVVVSVQICLQSQHGFKGKINQEEKAEGGSGRVWFSGRSGEDLCLYWFSLWWLKP